ncbi:hypothetical protein RY831_13245 [Noviherbaspirillum sp. CPCC 100848]|uniref:Uncharacterized protein n=1 Tax=Noviherbaspirillum album TaxID=3080276 RepID=A0ABU6J9M1_9BURK|nr:hypothetical protein [Noviherbaspirillum sp. CPCC 100848]MEC4720123.1 hypothetical protein [Noviherbaspirillum sp. CPCC 100848]
MANDSQQGQGIMQPGSFRIGDSVEMMAMRQRHQELARKIRDGAVSETERNEYLRLDDALHEHKCNAGLARLDDGKP